MNTRFLRKIYNTTIIYLVPSSDRFDFLPLIEMEFERMEKKSNLYSIQRETKRDRFFDWFLFLFFFASRLISRYKLTFICN